MPRFLHVGCGPQGVPLPHLFDGWQEIRLDTDAAVMPDMLGSMLDIGLPDNSVDGVYASHVLEHVAPWEVDTALAEIYRVLRPGGYGLLITPDLAAWAQRITDAPQDVETIQPTPNGYICVLDALFGYTPDVMAGKVGMRHLTAFTQATLARHLYQAGFAGRVAARDMQLFAEAYKPEEGQHNESQTE